MEIGTGRSIKLNEADAVFEAFTQLTTKIGMPTFIYVVSTVEYNNEILLHELNKLVVNCKIIGGTSCIGIMTETGYSSDDKRALGLFGIRDVSGGSYGVAALPISNNPQFDGQEVIRKALDNAERPGELPALILMTSAPGHEEALMNGIMNVVGEQVPIFGGTSADNSISGLWQQFCGNEILQNGIVVAAIFTSRPIGYAFHCGYMPTEHIGTITQANSRIVSTIDNKPAADVYNQWTGNILHDVLGTHANILALTTLYPLGREIGKIGNIPYYTLSHPHEVFADGAMSFFSDMSLNDKIVLMNGTIHSLKNRIKRVIHLAKENFSLNGGKQPKGAFIIYCAGCFLAIQDEIQDVIDSVHSELASEPFIGMFSFGEQGCLFGSENRHGNLMMSVIIFG